MEIFNENNNDRIKLRKKYYDLDIKFSKTIDEINKSSLDDMNISMINNNINDIIKSFKNDGYINKGFPNPKIRQINGHPDLIIEYNNIIKNFINSSLMEIYYQWLSDNNISNIKPFTEEENAVAFFIYVLENYIDLCENTEYINVRYQTGSHQLNIDLLINMISNYYNFNLKEYITIEGELDIYTITFNIALFKKYSGRLNIE